MQVSFDAVLVVLEMSRTSKKGKGIVDTLMQAMEEYMGRLEEKVKQTLLCTSVKKCFRDV